MLSNRKAEELLDCVKCMSLDTCLSILCGGKDTEDVLSDESSTPRFCVLFTGKYTGGEEQIVS